MDSLFCPGVVDQVWMFLMAGLLFGFVSGSVDIKGANWGSTDSWPTDEMKSR